MHSTVDQNILKCVITGVETRVFGNNIKNTKTIHTSSENHPHDPRKSMLKTIQYEGNINRGFAMIMKRLHVLVQRDRTINKQFYFDFVNHLREAKR